MEQELWDVIVVGAGVIGSWTAHHLSKNGCSVLLLDQFLLPHTRGGSSGLSRLIRFMYKEECLAGMMEESYQQWRQLEADSGQTLIKITKLLGVDTVNSDRIQECIQTGQKFGNKHVYLNPDELRQRYPMIRYPDNYHGLLDPEAGMIVPDKCLHALRESVLKYGGRIQDGVQVQNVTPGSITTLVTNKGNYHARSVVVTAGAWSKDLLSKVGLQLPIRTIPGMHAYWKLRDPSQHSADNSPVLLDHSAPSTAYLFPSLEYPGMVKVGISWKSASLACHPDERDAQDKSECINTLQNYVKEHFPCVESKPSIIEPCLYARTPDELFFLDRHPDHHNIIIGAGFSGMGFKFSPVVGRLLSELATNRTPSYDISEFRIDRFINKSKL